MGSIYKFEYRLPRMTTGLDVDFVVQEETFRGYCRDITEAGIRAEFDGIPADGSSGLVILRHSLGMLKLRAQVAYIEKDQVGLTFVFASLQDRGLAFRFIASIAKHPHIA